MHKQSRGFRLNPLTLKSQQELEQPLLGEFSVLILAAAVAHDMEVVATPKLWASVTANQPSLGLQNGGPVKEEFSIPYFQKTVIGKKLPSGGAQSLNDLKTKESGLSALAKHGSKRSSG